MSSFSAQSGFILQPNGRLARAPSGTLRTGPAVSANRAHAGSAARQQVLLITVLEAALLSDSERPVDTLSAVVYGAPELAQTADNMNRNIRLLRGLRISRAITCLLAIAASGCEDIDWLWWQGSGQRRPSERRVLYQKAPMFARSTVPESVPPAAAPDQTQRSAPLAPPANVDLYQLLLLSEPSSVAMPDNIRAVRLRHATAGELGRLIEYLYIPAGPGGTDGRYFLVYESPEVWAAAAAFALQLDVPALPAAPSDPPAEPGVAFEQAVGRFYHLNGQGARGARACGALVETFGRLAADDRLDAPLQWAAAMLAGGLAVNWQNDLEAAQRFFTLAQAQTTGGSPEELMAWAKYAEALTLAGDIPAARLATLDLLSRCAKLGRAYAYQKAHAQALALEQRLAGAQASQK